MVSVYQFISSFLMFYIFISLKKKMNYQNNNYNDPEKQVSINEKNQKKENITKKIISSFSSLSSTYLLKNESTPIFVNINYHLEKPFGENVSQEKVSKEKEKKKEPEKEIK